MPLDVSDGGGGASVFAADDSIVVTGEGGIYVGEISDLQHGERGGGDLHAIATGDTAGFMSAADKTKLNALPSGGITLAGDVTGAHSNNAVVQLTGSGGVVAVPSAAFALGTTVATSGAFRFPTGNAEFIMQRNAVNTANEGVLRVVGGAVMLGPGSGQVFLRHGSGSVVRVDDGTTTVCDFTAANLTTTGGVRLYNNAALGWGSASTAANINHTACTTNATPATLTITPQQPWNNVATSGANNVPGSLRVDLGTNTNGYITSYPNVHMRWGGTDRITFGWDNSSQARIYFGGALSSTAPFLQGIDSGGFKLVAQAGSNCTIACGSGGNLFLSGADGSPRMSITASLVSMSVASLSWGETLAPSLSQATRTTNAAPNVFTIATQLPWNNGATSGANNVSGSFRLDLGTNTNSYTTSYAEALFRWAGADRIRFGWNGTYATLRADLETQLTVGAAGAAAAVPASPAIWVKANIGGTTYVAPFFAVS